MVNAARFGQGMMFDEYVRFIASPANLAREGSQGPRRDWSDYLRKAYDAARVPPAHAEAWRWLVGQPGGPAHVLALSEEWSSDCRRDIPIVARLADAAGLPLRIFTRDGQTMGRAPFPQPDSPNADLMADFLNRRDGETFQSIPIIAFYSKDFELLYRYGSFPPSTARTASAPPRTARRPARLKRPARRGASESSPRCWPRPSTRCGARPPSTNGRPFSTSGCGWARWHDRVSDLVVIGRDVPKRDGADKVTGRTRYLHDLELPRLAHGKILRARHPHARLVRIDVTRAAALPGVLAVVTGADVEQHPFGFAKDQVALKTGKVRCVRDEIAAVAAESAAIAEEALDLIEVEYAELPAVFDPLAAVRPGAPLVHEGRPTNHTDLRYQFSHGDVERAFATAAAVVEGEFRLNFVTPACLGTMVAIADWDAEDRLTMSSTTQVPFLYQRDLAQALGITGDRVRVLQPPVGGNFGRGLDLYPIDVIAALLARRARRPVKIEFERLEEFVACPTREPCTIRLVPPPTRRAGCWPATATWSSTTAPMSPGAPPRRT